MNKQNYDVLWMLIAMLVAQCIVLGITFTSTNRRNGVQVLLLLTVFISVIVVSGLAINSGLYSKYKRWISPGDLYTLLGLCAALIVGLTNIATVGIEATSVRVNKVFLTCASVAGVYALVVASLCIYWESKLIQDTPLVVSQETVNDLYMLLHKFDTVMKANGIRYFITCGTLLGSVRHGGLIPWDDDVDVAVMEDDMSLLYSDKVLRDLAQHGIELEGKGGGFIQNTVCKKAFLINKRSPFIDIFPMKLSKTSNRYEYSNPVARFMFPKETFHASDIFDSAGNLKLDYKFGPLSLPGPVNGVSVLTQAYGPDVLTHYYVDDAHGDRMILLRRKHVKKKMPLTPELIPPRLPSSHLSFPVVY